MSTYSTLPAPVQAGVFTRIDSRIQSQVLGITLPSDRRVVKGVNGHYLELPVSIVKKAGECGEVVTEGKRNQHLEVIPCCLLNLRPGHYSVLVEPNPAYAQYGAIQGSYIVEPSSETRYDFPVSFHITVMRDISSEVFEKQYAVRLYVLAR